VRDKVRQRLSPRGIRLAELKEKQSYLQRPPNLVRLAWGRETRRSAPARAKRKD